VSTVLGPDPRFGMLAPVLVSRTVATPGGKTEVVIRSREALLSDPLDPLSLLSLTETTTRNGRLSTRLFDAASLTWTATSPAGRQSVTTLDPVGRVLSTASGGLEPVVLSYDGFGRLASTDRGGRLWQQAYGPDGTLASVTDPLGQISSWQRDAVGRVLVSTRPDGESVVRSYDPKGNLASLTPPARPAHLFGYTPVDLRQSYTPPDIGLGSTTTSWSYDLDRALVLLSRPDGQSLSRSYDGAGRLSVITAPSGARSSSYDPQSGKLVSISGPDGVTLGFGYDGPLLTSVNWSGPVAGVVEWTHDDDLRVIGETVNGGFAAAFGFDDDGLLASAGELTLTRDTESGLLTATTLAQTGEAFSYSTFGELAFQQASAGGVPLFEVSYLRDALGRITERTETVEGVTHTYGYSYDLAGRLVEVTEDGVSSASYAYDPNGNRLERTTSGGTVAGTYDDQDRLLSWGTLAYTYTAAGELLTKTDTALSATTTYQYDLFGNLRSVTLPGGTLIEYLVDGQNRRIGKKLDGVLDRAWLWQDQLRPVAELDGSGNVVARFVYGTRANVPEYMVKGGSTYRFFHDHLGSVRLVVDATTGAVAQRLDYDEWGRVLLDTNPGFQPFGFAGGLHDPDTGLVRFGARDYDAEVGRWTSKDPVLFEGGDANLYRYVVGDPMNGVDARGLRKKLACVERCGAHFEARLLACSGFVLASPLCRFNPKCYLLALVVSEACGLGASGAFAICVSDCPDEEPQSCEND